MIGPGLKHIYVRKIGESCNVMGLVKAFVFKDSFYLFVCTFMCMCACLSVQIPEEVRKGCQIPRSWRYVWAATHVLNCSESVVSTLNR